MFNRKYLVGISHISTFCFMEPEGLQIELNYILRCATNEPRWSINHAPAHIHTQTHKACVTIEVRLREQNHEAGLTNSPGVEESIAGIASWIL